MCTNLQKPVSRDPAINEMVTIAGIAQVPTVWDRYKAQHPQCKFGIDGVCCRLCHMGPCRITPKAKLGICGADGDTIAARNLLREIAAGAAAHSDHGRMLVRTLKLVSQGKGSEYKIADPHRLREAARFFGIETSGRPDTEIAGDLADFFRTQFAWSESPTPRSGWRRRNGRPCGENSASSRRASTRRWWRCCTARTWAWTTTIAT